MSKSLNGLRDILIASLHHDQVAVSRISLRLGDREFVRDLAEICKPFDEYTNDPRMEAAYYLFIAPIAALEFVASDVEDLLRLPFDGEAMDTSISCHLVRCVERLVAEREFSPSKDVARLIATV
jgi:hypothetical protein